MKAIRAVGLSIGLLLSLVAAISPASASHRRVRVHVHGGFHWGDPYNPYWGYAYGPPYGAYAYAPENAMIDTDVEPEKAKLYLDGEEIGVADDYDGFPEYLAVDPGRHTLEFRAPGYRTLRLTLRARRGAFYSIDRKLRPAAGGEDEERDELKDDRAPEGPRGYGRSPEREEEDEDRDQEQDQDRDSARERAEDERDAAPPAGRRRSEDTGREKEPGRSSESEEGRAFQSTLMLRLRPQDAAVYLDGRLLGAGKAVTSPEGVKVDPGRHTLEVVKPGFEPYRTTLVLQEGESRTLTIRLEAASEEGESL